MIGVKVKVTDETRRVKRAAKRAAFKNLGHAAGALGKTAERSIRVRKKKASAPGTPPHTRTKRLRKAIAYDVDQSLDSAIIGPRESIVGDAGMAHEFGGEFRDETYPQRPFMGPALEKNAPRFAADWQGTIGE